MIDISCTPGWIKTIGHQVCTTVTNKYMPLNYTHRKLMYTDTALRHK